MPCAIRWYRQAGDLNRTRVAGIAIKFLINSVQRTALQEVLKPILLRRLKEDVETLPEKEEVRCGSAPMGGLLGRKRWEVAAFALMGCVCGTLHPVQSQQHLPFTAQACVLPEFLKLSCEQCAVRQD